MNYIVDDCHQWQIVSNQTLVVQKVCNKRVEVMWEDLWVMCSERY